MADPRDDEPVEEGQSEAASPPQESSEHYTLTAFREFTEASQELQLDAQPGSAPPSPPPEAIPAAAQTATPDVPEVAPAAAGEVNMPAAEVQQQAETAAASISELAGPAESPAPPSEPTPLPAPQQHAADLAHGMSELDSQPLAELPAPAAADQPPSTQLISPPLPESPDFTPQPGEGWPDYAQRISELAAKPGAISQEQQGVEMLQKAFKGTEGLDQEDARFTERNPQDMQSEVEAAMRDATRFATNRTVELFSSIVDTLIAHGRALDDLNKRLERDRD